MTTRAVVMARGLGRRLREEDASATLDPDQQRAADAGLKPLMPVAGRPFLDYVLATLMDAGITSVALVVPPGHDAFARYYARDRRSSRLSIAFVVQQEPRGTADAVASAESWTMGEPFLVLNGDNLYPADALRRVAALDTPGFPIFDAEDLARTGNFPPDRIRAFGLALLNDDGRLVKLIEKPEESVLAAADPRRSGISMNCWRFDSRIFRYCRAVNPSSRGELELNDAIMLAVADGVPFVAVPAKGPVLDLSRRADAADLSRRLEGVAVQL